MNETPLFSTIPVAVPPMLERALGYTGDAWLVALYVDLGGDWSTADGHVTTVGEWDAAALFFKHPLVAPHLRPYHLGSLEEPPLFYLLLDRKIRCLSIVPVAEALQLLREQWGASEESVLVVDVEEWDTLVAELLGQMQRSPTQLAEDWQTHQRAFQALQEWLEGTTA